MRCVVLEFLRCLALDAGKTIRALPRYTRHVLREKRRQARLAEFEAERLDRIRNPSRYLGK